MTIEVTERERSEIVAALLLARDHYAEMELKEPSAVETALKKFRWPR